MRVAARWIGTGACGVAPFRAAHIGGRRPRGPSRLPGPDSQAPGLTPGPLRADPLRPMRALLQRLSTFVRRLFAAPSGPLCDRCKWDYGDACRRPERPNATTCPDYEGR